MQLSSFVDSVHRRGTRSEEPPEGQAGPLEGPPPRPDEGALARMVTTSADKPDTHLPTIAKASSQDRDGELLYAKHAHSSAAEKRLTA